MEDNNFVNRSMFKNSQDQQYRISVAKYPADVKTKEDKGHFISKVQGGKFQWSRENLKQKLKNPNHWSSFMSGHLQNLGYLPDSTYNKISTKIDGICADFIFLDFDNKDKDGNKLVDGYLSYDEALSILQKSGYNFVLSTSHSHTSAHHKLHILISTLKPIDSAELYKYYLAEVSKIFAGYPIDRAVSSIANNKNGGNLATIRVDVEFEKNDFHLENVDLSTRKTLKQISTANVFNKDSDIPPDALDAYAKQVNNMYGMIVDKGRSSTKYMMLRRNENDNNPGVFQVPYSPSYDPKLIFDNRTKDNGSKKEFETFYSLDDYVSRTDPNKVRGRIQSKISNLIADFIDPSIDRSDRHKYLITNEGLGKSTTVLGLGKKEYPFIYATYTLDGMHEKANYLKNINVDYRIILSVKEILNNSGFGTLVPSYDQYLKDTLKPSFRDFLLEKTNINYSDKVSLLNDYDNNNKQIQENVVILMTSAKLKVMMMTDQGKIMKDDKPIIFDEFVDSEWKTLTNKCENKYLQPSDKIVKTWGGDEGYFDLYKQESFFDLLSFKKVLVLTTERSLAGIYFWKSDYAEMAVDMNELWDIDVDFEKMTGTFEMTRRKDSFLEEKLAADNVYYLLLRSTSKKNLLKLAKIFENTGAEIITDGLKGSDIETLTHLGVKGMNHLSEKDIVVFGTLKTEIVVKEMFVNNKEYFKRMFGGNLSEEDLIKKAEPYIQSILIETQVSQSIGRNSGFRFKGRKCVVLLPVMQSNSYTRLKRDFNFNYISPNILIVEFNEKTNTLQKVRIF